MIQQRIIFRNFRLCHIFPFQSPPILPSPPSYDKWLNINVTDFGEKNHLNSVWHGNRMDVSTCELRNAQAASTRTATNQDKEFRIIKGYIRKCFRRFTQDELRLLVSGTDTEIEPKHKRRTQPYELYVKIWWRWRDFSQYRSCPGMAQ